MHSARIADPNTLDYIVRHELRRALNLQHDDSDKTSLMTSRLDPKSTGELNNRSMCSVAMAHTIVDGKVDRMIVFRGGR